MAKTIERLIGENVKRHRLRSGWDQQRLADEVNGENGRKTRLHRSAISQIETGDRALTVADIALIALALKVPPGALLILPESDADGLPIDEVQVGQALIDRDRIQMVGDALDPESPAQFLTEISRDLVARTAEARALSDRLDDLQSLAMSGRVSALRQIQASQPVVEDGNE